MRKRANSHRVVLLAAPGRSAAVESDVRMARRVPADDLGALDVLVTDSGVDRVEQSKAKLSN
jgi:hypothetical protein